jgi:putative DNA primase/helicase
VLLHCFASCPYARILAALGLRPRDLFAQSSGAHSPQPKPAIEAVYQYRTLDDVVRFEKVRYRPKRFRMRVPDPKARGGYRWSLQGIERILYRWPDLLEWRRVFVVEGEKAADRLRAIGVAATCGSNGAGLWLPTYVEALWRAGCAEVALLPDHDGPGQRFATRVAAACHGYRPDLEQLADPTLPPMDPSDPLFAPLTVKVVRLPDLHAREDVVDWLDRGGTREELIVLTDRTTLWGPHSEEAARTERARLLNAERQRRWRARRRKGRPVEGDAVSTK